MIGFHSFLFRVKFHSFGVIFTLFGVQFHSFGVIFTLFRVNGVLSLVLFTLTFREYIAGKFPRYNFLCKSKNS